MHAEIPLTEQGIRLLKALVWLACLGPLVYYGWAFSQEALGPEPIETVSRGLGGWALRLLLLTLTVTPLRKLARLPWLGRVRRMLGLFSFFYASLHAACYLWLEQFLDWPHIADDILTRPLIIAGVAAYGLLLPLAATSYNGAIRRLGGRRWQELHRSIYAIGLIAVLHSWWMVKPGSIEPLLYTLALAALLGSRYWLREQERRRQLAGAYAGQVRQRIIPIKPDH
jgi:methionine sulfoxide reductase heme-binding subunit